MLLNFWGLGLLIAEEAANGRSAGGRSAGGTVDRKRWERNR